jgi:hypothetical protein
VPDPRPDLPPKVRERAAVASPPPVGGPQAAPLANTTPPQPAVGSSALPSPILPTGDTSTPGRGPARQPAPGRIGAASGAAIVPHPQASAAQGRLSGGARGVAPAAGITGRSAGALLSRLTGPRGQAGQAEPRPLAGAIARVLVRAVRDGGGEVTLRLMPESLGRVTIRLSVEGGAVTAVLSPATEPARALLEGTSDDLRAALEARGLRVERIEVDGSRMEARAGTGAEPGETSTSQGQGRDSPDQRPPPAGLQGPHGPDPEGGAERGVIVPGVVAWVEGARVRVDAWA